MHDDAEPTLHTFAFADLAGFTALTEVHGDEQAADLASQFCERMRALTAQFEADVVKSIGDAVMIRCGTASSAIELMLAIMDEEEARSEFPAVRIGMHTGPATERSGDWYGATVNVAARVSAAAAGGEILLTKATADQVGPLAGVELQSVGSRSFKNVDEAVSLFRAARSGAPPSDKLAIDPVCQMRIAEGAEIGRLSFEGRDFRFCSLNCAQRFAAAPERYDSRG